MEENQLKKAGFVSGLVLVLLFVVFIFGFSIADLFNPVKERSESEKRALAQKPAFTLDALFAKEDKEKFTLQFEDYVTDQFVFRDSWIGIKTYTEKTIGKTDMNGVYFAKEDYLITKTDADGVDKEQEEKNISRLDEFVKKYETLLGKGHVSVMLIPTAADILSDYMPAFTDEYDQKALLERLEGMISPEAWVRVRDSLMAHKEEYLYYRTDHHWTALGAYYAYREFAKSQGLPVRELSDYKETIGSDEFYGTLYSKVNLPMKYDTVTMYDDGQKYRVEYDANGKYSNSLFAMNRLEEKDKYMVYLDGNHALVQIRSTNKNGRKLLVIKDSYAHTFLPFIAQDYEEITMVDFRYMKLPVSALMEMYPSTDVLLLYNATNFVVDEYMYQLVR